MRRILLLAAALLAARPALAEPDMNAGELAHAVDRLATTTRVLYVAAHPDDENTRLLAYLANVRHLQVAYLSMTRGGGGQNLIGSEQGELLDVIRTEELLAARQLDRARQRFTLARDFGYSKSADETLARWGHEQALGDVVWVIRRFQPDVVITRFDEDPPNHGHHTASAILAREAVVAAGDAKRFPEQLAQGVTVWKVDRLLHNGFYGRGETPPPGTIPLDVGVYDPRLGLSMGELAARSRSQHKSQGFGVSEVRGAIVESFTPLWGTRPKDDLLGGLPSGWERYGAAARPYTRALAEARRLLERDHPERALPALLRADAALEQLPDEPRVRDARHDLAEIIAASAGLYLRITAPRPVVVPGGTLELGVEAIARTASGITVARIAVVPGGAPVTARPLTPGKPETFPVALVVPADTPPSSPYWLAQAAQPGRYPAADPRLVGEPRAPASVRAEIDLTLGGRTLRLERPVVYAWTDPVQGERVRPLSIVPPGTVTPARAAVMFPGARAGKVAVRVRAARDGLTGQLALEIPAAGWTISPAQAVALAHAGDETLVSFDVTPPPGATATTARPVLRVGDATFSLREDVIDHPHIPVQLVLRPASIALVPVELRLPRGRIGYVRGSGDSVAEDLTHVGFAVEELDDATLRGGDLDRFAAIILGIRAYNTRPGVRAAHERLMAFVERGGTLIVQYNTQNRLSGVDGPIGPFPLELGRDRITDENAAPTLLDAKHPVFTSPNPLGAADWAGWVQERGIYFAAKWDPRYRPLLRFADPGEAPVDGALLVATHGKGRYVYTGLVFFRQLPAGVPGAYRLLANLIGAR